MRDSMLSMCSALSPIAVYDIRPDSLIYKELATYAVLFEELSARIDETIRECIVSTALYEGLYTYEEIIGPRRTDLSASERRMRILTALNAGENDFTMRAIKRYFSSFGFDCTILERPEFFELYIIPEGNHTRAEQDYIIARAWSFLPAHLNTAIEFRTADWDDYDDLLLSFDEWDELAMTWNELDRYEGE